MADQLRDEVVYFKTWLAFTDNKREEFRRDMPKDVPDIEAKLAHANDCVKQAQNGQCPDLVEIFADVAIQLEDRLELARRKAERIKDQSA